MSNFLTKDGLRTSTRIVIRKQLAFHFTAMVLSQNFAGVDIGVIGDIISILLGVVVKKLDTVMWPIHIHNSELRSKV